MLKDWWILVFLLLEVDQEAHTAVLKQETDAGTWCMDRSIVTVSFPFWNSATAK